MEPQSASRDGSPGPPAGLAAPSLRVTPTIDAAVNAGIRAFNRGRFHDSIAHFDRAIRVEPGHALPHLFRAEALQALKRAPEAWRAIAGALRYAPDSPHVRLRVARLLMGMDRFGEALAHCRAAIRLDKDSAEAFALKAELESTLGRPASAWSSFQRVLALRPKSAAWQLQAALRLKERGDLAKALACCRRAVRLDPHSPAARQQLSELLWTLDRRQESLKALCAAARLEPRSAPLRLRLAALWQALGRPSTGLRACEEALRIDPEMALAHLLRAELLAARGSLPQARRSLSQAASRAAPCADLLVRAARLWEHLGRPREALRYCLRAQTLSPGSRSALELGAGLAWKLGDPGGALRRLERLLALNPSDGDARRKLAETYRLLAEREAERGRPLRALARLRLALRHDPGSTPARLRAAGILMRLGREHAALAQYARALAREPRLPAALLSRAELEDRLGYLPEARASLRRFKALPRSGAAALLRAAQIFMDRGGFDEALTQLRAACRADPRCFEARVALARLLLWRADARGCRAAAGRAIALGPSGGQGFLFRGAARILQRQPSEALADLDRAVAAAPKDPEARLWRGEAKRLLGRPREAKSDLSRTLASWPMSLPGLINWVLAKLDLGEAVLQEEYDLIRSRISRDIIDLREELSRENPARSALALERALRSLGGNRSLAATFWWGRPRPRLRRHVRFTPRDVVMELQARIRFGEPERVLRAFDDVMEGSRDAGFAASSRGELCLWLGRYEEAEAFLRRSLELDPRLRWPHIGLAGLRALEGRYARALQHIELALKNEAAESAVCAWRGEIYRLMGDARAALQEFDKAALPLPYRPALWLNRALAFNALGDASACRETFLGLSRHMPHFLLEAAAMAGLPRRPAEERPSEDIERILQKGLDQMKGNRSSWMYTYFDRAGRLRHIPLRGIPVARIPGLFAANAWMFDRSSLRAERELTLWDTGSAP